MNAMKKNTLSKEASQQLKALKMISRWRTLAIGISAIGVSLAYAGFRGTDQALFLGIPGILLSIAGFAGAAILNLGIKNGKQNVEKILRVLEEI